MIDNRRKSVDAYMPLWIGDYLADTTHLTTEQHGAYLLLLMAYWRKGGPLPADEPTLARIAKMTTHKWKATRPIMVALFIEENGVWRSKRADAELEKANALKAARSASGKRGAEVSNSKRTGKIVYVAPHAVNQSHEKTQGGFEVKAFEILEGGLSIKTAETSHINLGNADVLPSAKPQPSPSPIRTRTEGGDSSDLLRSHPENHNLVDSLLVCSESKPPPRPSQKPISSKVERGTRWTLSAVPEEWIVAAEIAHPMVDVRAEAVAFVNWWLSAPGSKGIKLNWKATFMGWIGRDAKRLKEKSHGKNNSGQPRTIDDNPRGNFAAIAERLRAERLDREGRGMFDA
jgi:uncharacterized protein YdaU (DUF1376 family)